MGMYTEFFFRAELKRETPEDLLKWLEDALDPESPPDAQPFDDSEFFTCPRWKSLLWGAGAVYHVVNRPRFYREYSGQPRIVIHSSLKDYGAETEAFVDWILPWVDAHEGQYLGYSLYEESDDGNGREAPTHIYMPPSEAELAEKIERAKRILRGGK